MMLSKTSQSQVQEALGSPRGVHGGLQGGLVKIPGPGFLEFINDIRTLGFLGFVEKQWREHGDVFQVRNFRQTIIFAMHPDAVEHITVRHRQNYDKLGTYEPMRKYLLGQGLVSSTGELWQRQRKLMAPFYTPKGVQAYAELMIHTGARHAERWQELASKGTEVDIIEEMAAVAAAIILKAMFSTETMESLHQMKDAVETMLTFFNEQMTGLRLPVLLWLPTPKNRKYLAARELVHRSISKIIAQRRATDEAQWPDDLLSRLMRARDEETGQAMSESLLRDESITTFVAGHETTARTMAFAWYALATNPKVTERLHEELDRVLGGSAPTVDKLRQLPYTLQVIKEVMRLYPAVPFYARDAIAADQIGGFAVPAGAAVMTSPYYTHRHPQFWENPEVFDPDRWTREREATRHDYAYHPFAAGPRTCIGNNFSLLETHLLLAILAQRFTLRLRAGFEPRWVHMGSLGTSNGMPMVITSR
jgi:cytochrome P450